MMIATTMRFFFQNAPDKDGKIHGDLYIGPPLRIHALQKDQKLLAETPKRGARCVKGA
jgi:hypothetical protein